VSSIQIRGISRRCLRLYGLICSSLFWGVADLGYELNSGLFKGSLKPLKNRTAIQQRPANQQWAMAEAAFKPQQPVTKRQFTYEPHRPKALSKGAFCSAALCGFHRVSANLNH